MSRPLAQSPLSRPAAGGRPGQLHRTLSVVPTPHRDSANGASLQRRTHGEPPHRQAHVHRPSNHRAEIRRRRTNVLFLLTMAFCASLFLAATTHSRPMMYALALTFLSLCAYCYRLVQLREIDRQSHHHDSTWFRAA